MKNGAEKTLSTICYSIGSVNLTLTQDLLTRKVAQPSFVHFTQR